MAKELRGPWPTLEARRLRRTHLAHAIPPGSMVADWEKFSAKNGNRVPHRSPGARDRWHPHLGAEKGSRPGPPAEESYVCFRDAREITIALDIDSLVGTLVVMRAPLRPDVLEKIVTAAKATKGYRDEFKKFL